MEAGQFGTVQAGELGGSGLTVESVPPVHPVPVVFDGLVGEVLAVAVEVGDRFHEWLTG